MDNTPEPWGGSERRKSPRLRKLIEDLQARVRENATAIERIDRRTTELAEQIEGLKKGRT